MNGTVSSSVATKILASQNKLIISKNLKPTLQSESISEETECLGSTVQVNTKKQFDKRTKWFAPKIALSYDTL